ncbi:hypothetical protein ABEY82_26080 [Priestia megaterium]
MEREKKQKFEGERIFFFHTRKIEAASKPTNQNLIITNKYYNKLFYFHNGYIEILDPVATSKTWRKRLLAFLKS